MCQNLFLFQQDSQLFGSSVKKASDYQQKTFSIAINGRLGKHTAIHLNDLTGDVG